MHVECISSAEKKSEGGKNGEHGSKTLRISTSDDRFFEVSHRIASREKPRIRIFRWVVEFRQTMNV